MTIEELISYLMDYNSKAIVKLFVDGRYADLENVELLSNDSIALVPSA